MHTITSSAAMATFLAQPLDPTLRRILTDRSERLADYDGYDLGELAHFLIVQPGDTVEAIEAALGFSPVTHGAEAVTDHGGWVEAVFVLSDDGFGWVLLVPNTPAVPAELLPLLACSEHRPPP
jgi:hypothetical protein